MTRRTMLSDLEIDEVSTVDRPANQHGLITFSKRHGSLEGSHPEEGHMPLGTAEVEVFDAEGAPVDPETLEHGALVYDQEGNEYVFAEDDEDYDEGEEEVGKASSALVHVPGGVSRTARAGEHLGNAGRRTRAQAGRARDYFTEGTGTYRAGRPGKDGAVRYRQGRRLNQRGRAAAAGTGAAGAAGGVGYLSGRRNDVGKSLGDTVLEELSKAVTEDDQRAIIAKALDEVEVAKAENAELWKAFDEERDARMEVEFIAKADEYNLPVAPEVLGPVLKRLVENMDEQDLEVLDTVFKSTGDLLYAEYGHVGGGANSSVIDSVDELAAQMVSKSGGDFTTAEASVALFDANPEAYDAYIAEGR